MGNNDIVEEVRVPCPVNADGIGRIAGCLVDADPCYGSDYTASFIHDELKKKYGDAIITCRHLSHYRKTIVAKYADYIRQYLANSFGRDACAFNKYLSSVLDDSDRYESPRRIFESCMRERFTGIKLSFSDIMSALWEAAAMFEESRMLALCNALIPVVSEIDGWVKTGRQYVWTCNGAKRRVVQVIT